MTSIARLTCSVHGIADCAHVVHGLDAAVEAAEVGRIARRRDRYAAQAVQWRYSSVKRVAFCGRFLARNATGVQVRVTATPDGGRRAGLAGLQSCGSVWACPTCSAKILAHRQSEVESAVSHWLGPDSLAGLGGGRVAMATFTVRHRAGQSAADVWQAVSTGWTGVTTGAAWQDTKRRYGIEHARVVRTGARAGQTRWTTTLPWLRIAEVTHGDAGWHVHLHVLLFLPAAMSDDGLSALYSGMWSRWNAALVSAGFDGGLQVNHAQFLGGRDVARKISEYVTKNTYSDPGVAAALEATRGDLKTARFGNRSAMQILRDVAESSEIPADVDADVARDRAIWHEYEQASRGRRQMTWSVGARDLLGLGAEVDDETIAETETGTADDAVLVLDDDAWRSLLALGSGHRTALLEAAERSTADAAALLDALGVAYVAASAAALDARAEARALAATLYVQ